MLVGAVDGVKVGAVVVDVVDRLGGGSSCTFYWLCNILPCFDIIVFLLVCWDVLLIMRKQEEK